MIALILAVLAVLLGSALCSGSETALLSVPILRVRQLAQNSRPNSLALLSIRQKINRPIATIVVINNVFNIVGSIIVGRLATQVFGAAWLGVFSAILTFLIIVFAEIIPKTIGERFAEPISLAIALPLRFLTWLLSPFVWLIERVTLPLTGTKNVPAITEAEIQFLTRIGYQEGAIEDDEADMIARVFQLNDLTAGDLMTPRVIVTYIRSDLTLTETQPAIIASQHSRIVVIEEEIDRVAGTVLKTELLTAILGNREERLVSSLTRPVHFVPETIRADKLLKLFQETREHLMVVLDEYGGMAGVITLEDVLEVIIGEIVDETDRSVDLQRLARNKRVRLLKSRGLVEASAPTSPSGDL
ncbi:MAG: hemolysin family protein [Cyanobacteria bacterium P01_H01_bin.15]